MKPARAYMYALCFLILTGFSLVGCESEGESVPQMTACSQDGDCASNLCVDGRCLDGTETSPDAGAIDGDGDGVPDSDDNCVNAGNPEQADIDMDGIGDLCDPTDDRNACLVDNGGCGNPVFFACTHNEGADPTCADIDECATENGGCGDADFFSCTNNEGAEPTCADIDECLTENGGCGDAAFYVCTNNEGAEPTCADIDECATENGGCGDAAFSTCTNNEGAEPTCADIDECATENGGCGDVAFYTCTNNEGAEPTCADIDECATENGGCGDAAFYSCTNNDGAAPTCADIDECAVDNGGCGNSTFYTCTNNEGAGPTCADIDECVTDNGGCGDVVYYTCTNNEGAAPTCADIDECAVDNGGCGDATFTSCTNNQGALPTCADIDECQENNGGCGDPSSFGCVNLPAAAPSCIDFAAECLSYNICIGECDGNVICRRECGNNTPDQSLDRYQALIDCTENCDQTANDAYTCYLEQCGVEREGCAFLNPVGAGTCGERIACEIECDEFEDAELRDCKEQCFLDSDIPSVVAYWELAECAIDRCPDNPSFQCAAERCIPEYNTCDPSTACSRENGGCGDPQFVACIDNEALPPVCTDINECAVDNGGCGDPVLFDCIDNFGAAPTCLLSEQGGINACQALNQCFTDCEGNDACTQRCIESADPEGVRRFEVIFECIETEQCRDFNGSADLQCINARCPDELVACGFNVPPAPDGNGTCGELLNCLANCPEVPVEDASICPNECTRQTSPAGLALYEDAVQCVQINCPDFGENCQQMFCLDELNACFE